MTLNEIKERYDYTALITRERLYLLSMIAYYEVPDAKLPDRPWKVSERRCKELENIAATICERSYDINGEAAYKQAIMSNVMQPA
jgi:hypothetical protein